MYSNEENWLRNTLIPNCLSNGKIIKNYDKNSPALIKHISINYLSTKESFMLTLCYKAEILLEYKNQEYSSGILVKKTPNVSKEAYEGVDFDSLFHNEIFAYTEVLPAIEKHSNKYPKYFYSLHQSYEGILVLGDFSLDGWKMTKDRFNLSLEHILLAVKELGRFHGKSYALKNENPTKFFNLINNFHESRFGKEPPQQWYSTLITATKRAIKLGRENSSIPNEFVDKLSRLIANVFTYGKEMVKPKEPLAILCHGDYLRNNLAFKYDEKNSDLPIDVMMFDFQTLRYSSPMIDLCTFMANSTGVDVRSKHFEEIFNCYTSELEKQFHENTTTIKNLPEFLSYNNLLKEYIRYLPYGLAIASCFLMRLHEPYEVSSSSELLELEKSDSEILDEVMNVGGEPVDKELGSLVFELYEFTNKYKVDIFGNFNLSQN